MYVGNGVVVSGLDVNDEARHVGLLRGGRRDPQAPKNRHNRRGGSPRPRAVGTIPISIIVLFFASLRALREVRANQRALR